ncbi:MAG: hypothetical protein RMI43_00400 [Candidatus Caldarchaeum sp.]|nr:hypothetical protein [Candidatus Caldarchaeum sp.]MCX8201194.1 hypothetical protein [Candidatus Caldarchaeum sp.]MDW8062613.1 hypothetical protein [Candidatus Caldarchaeum sp.]MDW8435607.1 hypothetical protein [Candidatus Caldarchaeum sp.]
MEPVKESPDHLQSTEVRTDSEDELLEAIKKAGIAPLQLKRYLKAAIRLRELEKQHGKSYQVLLKEYEKKYKESVKLEYSIGELLEKRRRIEEDLLVYLEQQKLTLETVNKVAAVIQSLKKYSIDVDDLENLARVAAKISETGADFKQIFEVVSKLDEVEKRLSEAESRYKAVSEDLRKLEEELEVRKKKLNEIVSWTPEIEQLVSVKERLMAEIGDLESKAEELKMKVEELSKEYEALLGFKADSRKILAVIDEKKNELNRLEEEIAHKKETLELLEEEVTSARSLLMLLQNPELVRKEDLEALSRQFANLANIKGGGMSALSALEPSLMENVRKRVVELVMPVIRTELVPKWVFEKLEKEFKDLVVKKTHLEEELEKLRADLGQMKSSKPSTPEQPAVQQPKNFRLLKKAVTLTSDSGTRIRLKCIYCQNSTLMILPVKEDLQTTSSSKDLLVTTCSSCGKDISVEPGFLLERFFKG